MKKEFWGIILCFVAITSLFFYKSLTKGFVPFPADVLVNEYQPWRSTSYLGFAPASIPHKAQYPDTVRQIYPWKTAALDMLKQKKLPLWNPYNFSGSPLLANFQSATLYPLNIFFAFTSQIQGWSILVAFQPLLAAIATYFFARSVGVGILGSILSGISFGFSGFMAVWLEYNTVGQVIAWLPLILLSIEALKKKLQTRWVMVFCLSITSALLAGHPQVFGYMYLFSLLYLVSRVQDSKKKIFLGIVSVIGIGIAGIQLLPGIELITLAARSPHDFGQLFHGILIQPWQFISLIFPNFFGNPATRTYWLDDTFLGKVTTIGLVPLFFLPAIFRRKEPIVRFFLWSTLSVGVLISANPVSYILYRLPLPLVSSSSPTLMSFLLAFCISILCGFGLDHWIREKHSIQKLVKRTIQVTIIVGLFFLSARLPQVATHGAVIERAVLYGAGIAGATLMFFWIAITKPAWMKAAVIGMLLLHIADLFIFFHRFNAFIPSALVYPEHEVTTFLRDHNGLRYWGYGTAAIPANLATQFKGLSPEGYDPLYPKWYGEFVYSYTQGALLNSFSNSTRSDAAIASGFGAEGLSDSRKNKVLDALSVGYILDRTENGSTEVTFPSIRYESAYNTGDWHIFKNKAAAPHAYLADIVMSYTDKEDFAKKFFAPSYNPAVSVLLATIPTEIPMSSTPALATITEYQSDMVKIQTQSTAPKILVLTDTYYPGWNATVDGKPVKILQANWTQRAVVVPQGTHTITMIYAPESVRVGSILSMISIGLLGLALILQKKHRI